MFADAVELASEFTFPVIISRRTWTGDVDAMVGAFVLLNSDGWIVTAAHIFDVGLKADRDRVSIAALEAQIAAVTADGSLRQPAKLRHLKRLRGSADRDWITNTNYWFGRDGLVVKDLTLFADGDVAVGRLDPFPADMARRLPVIKNPATGIRIGTSLIRLGFPFANVSATYDAAADMFSVSRHTPYFPLEGVLTRAHDRGVTNGLPVRWIETSAPGLMGHSGGPLLDVHGRLWGVQSRTSHLPLGYRSEIEIAGKKIAVPPQFINLGLAVHPSTVTALCDQQGVTYDMSPD